MRAGLFFGRASLVFFAAASCLVLQAQAAPPETSAPRPLSIPAVPAAIDCTALVSANVSQAVGAPIRITSATVVNDDKLPAYCNVQVSVDEYGKLDLHLPVAAWTQRLLFGGGLGQSQPAIVGELASVAWQDLGKRGHEEVFATNYQFRADYAYRMMHLQVLAAKVVVSKYYGQAPKFSYYNACSEPGREGMMEVERFPEDFDGVAAGCPPVNVVVNKSVFWAWNVRTNTGPDGQAVITADKLPILHKAVLDECDAADGVKDGIISDPLSCHPDLSAIECKPGQDSSSCLSTAQIHVAKELYRGAHDPQGGKLAPIGDLPGSELAWKGVFVPTSAGPEHTIDGWTRASAEIRSEFSDPPLPANFNLADMKFDRATFEAVTKLHYVFDATDPDLTPFQKAGHKLILWQSLGDIQVLPAQSILYYTALQKQMGEKAVDQFVRFYVLPGVFHCGGGDGPSIKDFLTPLMLWVERGVAPGALVATHVPAQGGPSGQTPQAGAAAVELTRPVYPYPYTAKYTGTGDATEAGSFVQGPPRPAPAELFNWWGSGFYKPGYEKWCTGAAANFQCKDSR